MLEAYSFHLTQLLYAKAAMAQLPTYRPFGKTLDEVGAAVAEYAAGLR